MGASHYKGTSLPSGGHLEVGDYLMSPNRRFVGVLQRNGAFAIYWAPLGMGDDWQPDSFEPGASGCLWASTPPATPSDAWFMAWKGGDPENPNVLYISRPGADKDLWQSGSHPGSGYAAYLMDTGEFQLVNSDKGIGWRSYAHVEPFAPAPGARDYWGLVSKAGNYAVSSKVGGDPPLDPTVPPSPPCVAVRTFDGSFNFQKAPDDELWEALSWIVDDKNLVAGIVLINKATGMALGSDGTARTRMTREVNAFSLWLPGPDYGLRTFALRLVPDMNLHLNLAGNSYADGSAMILWIWKGPDPNLLWQFA